MVTPFLQEPEYLRNTARELKDSITHNILTLKRDAVKDPDICYQLRRLRDELNALRLD